MRRDKALPALGLDAAIIASLGWGVVVEAILFDPDGVLDLVADFRRWWDNQHG